VTGGFGERLGAVFAARGQLCVGIDPHDYLLDAWGLPRTPAGLREFGLRVVDAAAMTVGIVKPQVAFFEAHGSAGFSALEEVLAAARAAGLLVIADAKRGDIGSSVDAYGAAWLTPGSALEADAVTLTAYTGIGSLSGVFALAERFGKGAFVLSATSNPESFAVQSARIAGGEFTGSTVAGLVTQRVTNGVRRSRPFSVASESCSVQRRTFSTTASMCRRSAEAECACPFWPPASAIRVRPSPIFMASSATSARARS
jgi:orotidine-5'-phosphate decarboxylase